MQHAYPVAVLGEAEMWAVEIPTLTDSWSLVGKQCIDSSSHAPDT